jgi:hypothetical protein
MSARKAAGAPNLRRIKAAAGSKSSGAEPAPYANLSVTAEQFAASLEHALADGRADALTPAALQKLMAAVCRAYRAQVDAGQDHLPLAERAAVAPTDVMVVCGGLLRAADLAVFELGMWQSLTGR